MGESETVIPGETEPEPEEEAEPVGPGELESVPDDDEVCREETDRVLLLPRVGVAV